MSFRHLNELPLGEKVFRIELSSDDDSTVTLSLAGWSEDDPDTLLASGLFDSSESDRIRTNTQRLLKPAKPTPPDTLYDDLVDKICVFYTRHPEPIPL